MIPYYVKYGTRYRKEIQLLRSQVSTVTVAVATSGAEIDTSEQRIRLGTAQHRDTATHARAVRTALPYCKIMLCELQDRSYGLSSGSS